MASEEPLNPGESSSPPLTDGKPIFCSMCIAPAGQLFCSRCKKVSYCNEQCRDAAWQLRHRNTCGVENARTADEQLCIVRSISEKDGGENIDVDRKAASVAPRMGVFAERDIVIGERIVRDDHPILLHEG